MKKKILSLVLCCVLISGLNSVQAFAASSDTLQNQIDANKDKIDDLQNQKNQIQNTKNQENDKLKSIQDQLDKKSLELQQSQGKVDEYQGHINTLQGKINLVQSDINKISKDIESVEKDIEKKEQEEAEKRDLLGMRLRAAYKTNIGEQILGVILGSDNLTDFMQKMTVITTIMQKDNELIAEVKKVQEDLKSKQKDLASKKSELDKQKSDVVAQQSQLKSAQQSLMQQRDDNKHKYDELSSLRNQQNNIISSLSDSEKKIAAKVDDLEEDNEALQKQLDSMFNSINNEKADDGATSNGQAFIRPAVGPITDDFGPRIHPIKHTLSNHTGVDIGGPKGAPIKASKSGTVVRVQWDTVYGNMVVIDHGNGYQTMYGHMKTVDVQVGQKVNQGQTIAYIDSQGIYSTGPHLHFEIRVNGQPQNPHNYVSGL
ncbi:peptidoglycan DD-metalloendopeptidase family protein [Clostridium sp. C8-1-8]|uniref:murein hydrolase activator EnvC family protein n=1 Tax=Clostridium sp. C8-1-8 TaxID=2698831 RepID=UPI0013700576|nr:peptidoglycan DD-metalloendopeptidase family protein [Clostridium sp. C8-1-8]